MVNTLTFAFADDDDFQSLDWDYLEGILTLNGEEVTAQGLLYVIEYGLKQSLTDSWSGHSKAQDYDKAGEAYERKLKGIIAGELSLGGRASDPIGTEINRLCRAAVDASLKKSEWKHRKGYDDAKGKGSYTKAVKAYKVKHFDALAKQAEANVAATAALAETAADL